MSEQWISLDPGETTGWAIFDGLDEKPVEVGETAASDFHSWITGFGHFSRIVCEDYKIRPEGFGGKRGTHDWSAGTTLRLIGAVEYIAWYFSSPLILQQPSIKPMGYRMIGRPYVKGKAGQHMWDAIAHGVYYLRKAHNESNNL